MSQPDDYIIGSEVSKSFSEPLDLYRRLRDDFTQDPKKTLEAQKERVKDGGLIEQPPQEPRMYRWWLLETFALVVSTSSLLSLTAVLATFNGHPASDWKGFISLNTLVSILGTISRSSLIFPLTNGLTQWKWMRLRKHERPLISLQHYDEASRGLWGAIMLLLRPTYASFASLGAFVVAVAAAFEPFTQQAVAFPNRDVIVGQAFLPRASFYNISDGASSRYVAAANVAMYNNIVGLGTPAVDSTITATCPTGNCQWAEYTSIGVCSSCVDTTSHLKTTYPNNTEEKGTCKEHGFTSKCPYSTATPNGLVSVAWEDGYTTAVLNMTSFDQGAYLLNGYTYTTMTNISMVAMLSPTNFVGYDCVIYGCAKKYTASVTNGRLSETIVKTYWNQSLPQSPLVPSAHYPGLVANLTTVILGTDLASAQDETFNFDYNALNAISTILQNTFGPSQTEYVLGNIQSDGTFAYDPAQGETSNQVVALWMNGPQNFSKSIEQLAEGLTNYMRLASPSEQAVGTATGGQPYIHVRWEWLALPYGLEFLTYMFILGTVIVAKRSDMPTWKASSLVGWFHDTESIIRPRRTKTNREMEQLARQTMVQLIGPASKVSLTQISTSIKATKSKPDSTSLSRKLRRAAEEVPGAILG